MKSLREKSASFLDVETDLRTTVWPPDAAQESSHGVRDSQRASQTATTIERRGADGSHGVRYSYRGQAAAT